MADCINETTHIARKDHRCSFCNDVIKKGERYEVWTFVECGEITTDRYHSHCAYAIQHFCDDDCYFPREIMEPLNAELEAKGITPAKTIHEAVDQWCESIKIV